MAAEVKDCNDGYDGCIGLRRRTDTEFDSTEFDVPEFLLLWRNGTTGTFFRRIADSFIKSVLFRRHAKFFPRLKTEVVT